MARSINKVAKRLALKQLDGKDINKKLKSECYYNDWPEQKMRRLIKDHYEMERYK